MNKAPQAIQIPTGEILRQIPTFAARGITEFTVHDAVLAKNKKELLKIAGAVKEHAPNLFISLPVSVQNVDRELVAAMQELYCSLELDLSCTEKNGTVLLDKKLWSSKARLLNEAQVVFGLSLSWGRQNGDTFRAFRERLDFAVTLYPNHIEFPQFMEHGGAVPSTGVFSSKDMDFARGMAFACRTFYTEGRAVPWFNAVVQALKVQPSQFFADFDEWQQCNNCSQITGFIPEDAPHAEIERMQLAFLKEKCSEKHREHLTQAIADIVRINGAFSRVAQEGEECVLELSYNADDLLSPCSMNIAQFCENVTMQDCTVIVFAGKDFPDYRIL